MKVFNAEFQQRTIAGSHDLFTNMNRKVPINTDEIFVESAVVQFAQCNPVLNASFTAFISIWDYVSGIKKVRCW